MSVNILMLPDVPGDGQPATSNEVVQPEACEEPSSTTDTPLNTSNKSLSSNSNNNNNANHSNNNAGRNKGGGRHHKQRNKRYHQNNTHNNKKWCKQFKRSQQQQQQQQQLQQQHQQQQLAQLLNKGDLENMKNQSNRCKHPYGSGQQKNLKPFIKNLSHRNHRGLSKFFLPDKRLRKELIIPPTKFLLGGNISDPLNLNSLQDEALTASMNAATPKSSPVNNTPPKIEVIFPPNIYDPLHLSGPVDAIEYEKLLSSPMKRKMKHRNRKKKPRKHADSMTTEGGTASSFLSSTAEETDLIINTDDEDKLFDESDDKEADVMSCSATVDSGGGGASSVTGLREKCIKDLRLELDFGGVGRKRRISENSSVKNKVRRMDSMDKIVSPVIPQPGAWKRPPIVLPMGAPRNRGRISSTSICEETVTCCDQDKQSDLPLPSTLQQQQQQPNDLIENEIFTTNTAATENIEIQPEEQSRMSEPPNTISSPLMEEATPKPAETKLEFIPTSSMPKKFPETARYQYGNYNRYYGFNSVSEFTDVRLKIFKQSPFLFKDKDVLDIGCNVGHMTTAVARTLNPKTILGIDIDRSLIAQARRNLSLYVTTGNATEDAAAVETAPNNQANIKKRTKHPKRCNKREYFPISFPICYGSVSSADSIEAARVAAVADATDELKNPSIKVPTMKSIKNTEFPYNCHFRTTNYVLSDEQMQAMSSSSSGTLIGEQQQYDLILCLSVTKWIHLNAGDVGLKSAFKRMFNQLRPGGKLILEAQNWASYKKRKKLTETIFNNYKNIEFFPNKFHEYLLSPEVGFSHSFSLGIPKHLGKGFRRPIQLYVKGDFTPSQICWSDSHHPQTPSETYRKYYADMKRPRHQQSIWGSYETTPHYLSGQYSQRHTPAYMLSSISQYYNPLETDSYLPSYDHEVQNRRYCFASPLYSTVWSPPSGRKSASQTPLFGSIRKINDDSDTTRAHVYPPTTRGGGGSSGRESIRSIDESSRSPQTRHVYATTASAGNSVRGGGGSSSTREQDIEYSSPNEHVYATTACDNSSSPLQPDSSCENEETIDECFVNENV